MMIDFDKQLSQLVLKYADWSDENQCYLTRPIVAQEAISGEKLLLERNAFIEMDIKSLIVNWLVQEGIEKKASHFKSLKYQFHPDRKSRWSASIRWIEEVVNPEKTDSILFRWVNEVNAYLDNPPPASDVPLSFESFDTFITHLQSRCDNDTSYAQSWLLSALKDLCVSIQQTNATSNEIKIEWAKTLVKVLPFVTSTYCIGMLSNELMMFYGVGIFLFALGRKLGQVDNEALASVGEKMRQSGMACLAFTGILSAEITRFNFALATVVVSGLTQSTRFVMSRLIGMGLLQHNVVMLSPEESNNPYSFKSLALAQIVNPLETYCHGQKAQWFSSSRQGAVKSDAFGKALVAIKALDDAVMSEAHQLQKTAGILSNLERNQIINRPGSHAAMAIFFAHQTLAWYFSQSGFVSVNNNAQLTPLAQCIQILETAIDQKNTQWFRQFRAAEYKIVAIKKAIGQLKTLQSEDNKGLSEALFIVDTLIDNAFVNEPGSQTAMVLNQARSRLSTETSLKSSLLAIEDTHTPLNNYL